MIKTGDNVMEDGLPTDIVIPCDSIHRFFFLKISLPLLTVLWAQLELEKALYAPRDLESLFSLALASNTTHIVHQLTPWERGHARRP